MTPHPLPAAGRPHRGAGLLLIVPAALTGLISLVVPTGQTILRSFQHGGGVFSRDSGPAGVHNYAELLRHGAFWKALVFSLSFAIVPVLVLLLVGPSLAAALDRAGTWPRRAGRLLLSLPLVVFSPVALAAAWLAGQSHDGGVATAFGRLNAVRTWTPTVPLITAAAMFGLLCGLALLVFLPVMRGRSQGRPLTPAMLAVGSITVLAAIAVALQAFSFELTLTFGKQATLTTAMYRSAYMYLDLGGGAATATLLGLMLGVLGVLATVIAIRTGLRVELGPPDPDGRARGAGGRTAGGPGTGHAGYGPPNAYGGPPAAAWAPAGTGSPPSDQEPSDANDPAAEQPADPATREGDASTPGPHDDTNATTTDQGTASGVRATNATAADRTTGPGSATANITMTDRDAEPGTSGTSLAADRGTGAGADGTDATVADRGAGLGAAPDAAAAADSGTEPSTADTGRSAPSRGGDAGAGDPAGGPAGRAGSHAPGGSHAAGTGTPAAGAGAGYPPHGVAGWPLGSRPNDAGRTVLAIAALVVVAAVTVLCSWPWLSVVFSQGHTAPLRPSAARVYFNTWAPPLLSAVVSVGTAYLAALGIGGLRPLGRKSEWLLLPFAPWLFVGIGPLSISDFENAHDLSLIDRFLGLVPPILLSVPSLLVLTLFCRTRAARWRAAQASGPAAFVNLVALPALPLAVFMGGVTVFFGAHNLLWPLLIANGPSTQTAQTSLLRQMSEFAGVQGLPYGVATPLIIVVLAFIALGALQIFYFDRLVIVTGPPGEPGDDLPRGTSTPPSERPWPTAMPYGARPGYLPPPGQPVGHTPQSGYPAPSNLPPGYPPQPGQPFGHSPRLGQPTGYPPAPNAASGYPPQPGYPSGSDQPTAYPPPFNPASGHPPQPGWPTGYPMPSGYPAPPGQQPGYSPSPGYQPHPDQPTGYPSNPTPPGPASQAGPPSRHAQTDAPSGLPDEPEPPSGRPTPP